MSPTRLACLAGFASSSLLALASLGPLGCSSSGGGSSPTGPSQDAAAAPPGSDAGGDSSVPVVPTDSGTPEAGPFDAGATTTIAAARTGNVTTTITVEAVVTALHGVPGDYSQWYIEDPAGGPSSGVAVYCDPDLTSCPKTIVAPAVNSLVLMTGKLSTYKGALQFVPTAQTVLQASTTPPPVPTVMMSDLAEGGNSSYRGVVVHLATKVTVDNPTPAALYDTSCDVVVDAGPDAAATDAGLPLCTGCEPPTYSGFQANDGMSNEVYIEQFFFNTDHLQSSPECASLSGMTAVTVGMTFSSITGILDVDPYAGAQALFPLADSDYTTP